MYNIHQQINIYICLIIQELINEGVDEEHNKKLAKDEVDDKDSPTESKYNSDFSDSESD